MEVCKTERETDEEKRVRKGKLLAGDDFCSWAGRHGATVEQLENKKKKKKINKKKRRKNNRRRRKKKKKKKMMMKKKMAMKTKKKKKKKKNRQTDEVSCKV